MLQKSRVGQRHCDKLGVKWAVSRVVVDSGAGGVEFTEAVLEV